MYNIQFDSQYQSGPGMAPAQNFKGGGGGGGGGGRGNLARSTKLLMKQHRRHCSRVFGGQPPIAVVWGLGGGARFKKNLPLKTLSEIIRIDLQRAIKYNTL